MTIHHTAGEYTAAALVAHAIGALEGDYGEDAVRPLAIQGAEFYKAIRLFEETRSARAHASLPPLPAPLDIYTQIQAETRLQDAPSVAVGQWWLWRDYLRVQLKRIDRPATFRGCMISVAALAVTALRWWDQVNEQGDASHA
jgi:hypothetical protein